MGLFVFNFTLFFGNILQFNVPLVFSFFNKKIYVQIFSPHFRLLGYDSKTL